MSGLELLATPPASDWAFSVSDYFQMMKMLAAIFSANFFTCALLCLLCGLIIGFIVVMYWKP